MITDQLLVDELTFIGIDGLDDKIIKKCLDIANRYDIDAERFVEEWIAFAQTNLNGVLKPTTVTLDTMERKQLSKNQEKSTIINETKEPTTSGGSAVKIYNNNGHITKEVNNILNAYNAGTTQKSVENGIKRDTTTFSPSTYNPEVVKPSVVYESRKDHGQIIETFGTKENLTQDTKQSPKCPNIKVTFLGKEQWNIKENDKYMYETPFAEVSASTSRINHLGQVLKKKYYPKGEEINENIICGRVISDGDRLNAHSVLFETTGTTGAAEVVTVNLTNIPRYAIFPGKILLLDAKPHTINRKPILMANKLYCDASPELPEQIPVFAPNAGPLKLIVASGPFTLSDNLAYQPLHDLIKYVISKSPDVLILIGPFVDKRHSSVVDGTIADTFQEFFENLLEKVTGPLQDTDIQIVVVPSVLEAHYHNVFPTLPFDPLPNLKNYKNIHMVSDPALIDINGIIIGVSSIDILFHLAKTEFICQPENTDRMSRFAEHILTQRCFYPLYPAQAAAPGQRRLSVDSRLLKLHGMFDVKPHIMILPSNLKKFIKNVDGCVVINPERLSKGYVGGTFACVNVYPGETQQSLADNITLVSLISINPVHSQEDDNHNLHYLSRLTRDCNSGGFFTLSLSIIVFLLYVLILLGLIKAVIGLCCNEYIGMAGLHLLIEQQYCDECDYTQTQISCNTEFCLNVVFFLVAPTALLLNMCQNAFMLLCAPRPCPETCRMPAGKDALARQQSTSTMKTKKATMDVYRDGDDSETYDTKYVLEQLHISEQSIRPEHTNYQSCRNNIDVNAKKTTMKDVHRLWP